MNRARPTTDPIRKPRRLPSPLNATPERVLLIYPPVYDTRLNWGVWQQPTTLLRLATYWKRKDVQVRLVDAFYQGSSRFRRESDGKLKVDDRDLNRWRYGAAHKDVENNLKQLKAEGWMPDQVYIECDTTFWWRGSEEMALLVRQVFPEADLILTGAYPTLAPAHALEKTGATSLLVKEAIRPLYSLPADLDVYETLPSILHLSFGGGQRTADEVVAEVEAAFPRVRAFSIADEKVITDHPDLFREVLERLAERKRKVGLYAIGNVEYHNLNEPSLPALMRRAGYKQIHFADDRHLPIAPISDEILIEDARMAVEHCHNAGFKPRTDELNASLCLGRKGENLSDRTRLATKLAHHVGALIIWPYQPAPEECPDLSLEEQNGKIFPMRARNGYRYDDYLEFLGLAAILNAKYHSRTFDFLGEGFMSRLFRDSVARQGWDPDPAVKGRANPLSRRN
jgi:hypothetical protein